MRVKVEVPYLVWHEVTVVVEADTPVSEIEEEALARALEKGPFLDVAGSIACHPGQSLFFIGEWLEDFDPSFTPMPDDKGKAK